MLVGQQAQQALRCQGPELAAQGGAWANYDSTDEKAASEATVIIVEEDRSGLAALRQAVPERWRALGFSALEEADGARLQPGRPVVMVLGPSQASAGTLDRVGALLRATPGMAAVLVVDEPSSELMRLALRAGVSDALDSKALAGQLGPAIAEIACQLERDLADAEASGRHLAAPMATRHGLVTSVFSPKGGVGKSVVAVNLATALTMRTREPTVILDLDLQFGDVAVMLRLQPRHTFIDAVSAGDLLDETLLRSFLARHEKSGVYVLAAPTSPSDADLVTPADMLRVLDLLKEMFAYVVIDTPPHLSEVVLQAVAASDTVAFVLAMDVPSVKNARLGLQAFQLLQLPLDKVALLLNRADSRVHLADHDVERALELRVDLAFPSEVAVPQSVNQGLPVLLAYPRSRFGSQVHQLAELVLARADTKVARQRRKQ
ncbi:MAG: AAA family ATPase [Acidimicrobiales bacterium]